MGRVNKACKSELSVMKQTCCENGCPRAGQKVLIDLVCALESFEEVGPNKEKSKPITWSIRSKHGSALSDSFLDVAIADPQEKSSREVLQGDPSSFLSDQIWIHGHLLPR